ncbi:MAG: tRNA uridine(34) 5-carboxymethylaminomethyl modification radical SAM/GNAT enzyme Elp3 [Candidatus Moranbacteria bacterium]|nr:tRNA uridine(34) 5-carboxymethylaminomethyl modification radical SAM/GNAT enzyme Elp3 [Candidatus Moranbacteria bacterium]
MIQLQHIQQFQHLERSGLLSIIILLLNKIINVMPTKLMKKITNLHHINLILEASKIKFKNPEKFLSFKKQFYGQNKIPQPTTADLRELYNKLVAQKKIQPNIYLEKAMLSRAIRTQSGVAVVAVLTKPSTCPGKCIFCPTEKNMPKSYLSNEPAVMRAIMNKFDAYNQVQSRLLALELNGHSTEKIELIVMGGTFSYFPKTYQKKFITDCFRAANEYKGKLKVQKVVKSIKLSDKNLKTEQKKNETAKHRIVGLTLETRPDYIDEKEIINFRNLGCTRVELGVQSIFNDVLIKNNRGHLVAQTIVATQLLKDAGFKINYHMMPGLLGSSISKDFKMFKELFTNSDFKPDMLKIYPTVVTKNSELYEIWKSGNYKPLTDKQFEKLIIKIKNEAIPPYTRIQRLIRDVPLSSIEAGPTVSNLRQVIEKQTHCQCIRCREIKGEYKINEKIILDRVDYEASGKKEIFLQFVSPDKKKLYSLLRLRISNHNNHFINALKNSALIREIHTYGKLTDITKYDKNSLPANAIALQAGPQHIGLGKKLILEAERITRDEFGLKKIAVISGVGVRNYYRKNGYKLRDTYMVKAL